MKCRTVFLMSLVLHLVFAAVSFAADPVKNTSSLLQELMGKVKDGSGDVREKDLYTRDPAEVLAALAQYQSDPSSRVREHAYTMGWKIGVTAAKTEIRIEVVESLATACGDSDGLVWQSASRRILSFPPQYFSDTAKQSIHALLARSDRQIYAIVVAGQANMTEEIPAIRRMLAKGTRSEYCGPLALARMGSEEDIAYCIRRVLSEPDDLKRITKMLHGLAYMRQPEAVAVLKDVLDSDKRLPCESFIDYDTRQGSYTPGPGWGFAQYALDILANTLQGFPVSARDIGSYSPADIEKARSWMKAQTKYTFTTEPTIYRPDIL